MLSGNVNAIATVEGRKVLAHSIFQRYFYPGTYEDSRAVGCVRRRAARIIESRVESNRLSSPVAVAVAVPLPFRCIVSAIIENRRYL